VTFSIADTIAGDWIGIFDASTSIANQDTANFLVVGWLRSSGITWQLSIKGKGWAVISHDDHVESFQPYNVVSHTWEFYIFQSTGSLVFRDGKSISLEVDMAIAPQVDMWQPSFETSDDPPFSPIADVIGLSDPRASNQFRLDQTCS
jgi:hypothetical protein